MARVTWGSALYSLSPISRTNIFTKASPCSSRASSISFFDFVVRVWLRESKITYVHKSCGLTLGGQCH